MSLELDMRVLWRFRVLVLAGLLLAILLAGMAMFKVDFGGGAPKLTYRQSETWQSTARLLITQDGFPEGRTTLPGAGGPLPGAATEEARRPRRRRRSRCSPTRAACRACRCSTRSSRTATSSSRP